jgi:hypothetical protein
MMNDCSSFVDEGSVPYWLLIQQAKVAKEKIKNFHV